MKSLTIEITNQIVPLILSSSRAGRRGEVVETGVRVSDLKAPVCVFIASKIEIKRRPVPESASPLVCKGVNRAFSSGVIVEESGHQSRQLLLSK